MRRASTPPGPVPVRRLARLLFPLLIILCSLPARSLHAQVRVGAIRGQVLDRRTLAPIQVASVALAGTTHVVPTDSAGEFRMPGVAAGRYTLEVRHLAYGARSIDVVVEPGTVTGLRLLLSETAIELEPLSVEALSAEEVRARGAGYRRNVVTRDQIARSEGTNMTMPDVLQAHVPTVRIRRLERVAGAPICIELRTIRSTSGGGCLSPVVYLDGVPVSSPTSLYGTLDVRVIESMEVIPANEAGVRFGSGALYGALLIETRRPGPPAGERVTERQRRFDWSTDPRGHATSRSMLFSTAGNAIGLAIGTTLARQCLHLREPSNDGLVSDCDLLPTLGAAAAALALPSIGSGFGSMLAGRTDVSQGQLTASSLGAAMVVLPGYALVMAGQRNDSGSLRAVGYFVVFVGAPIMSTAADYMFRKLRGDGSTP